jgi:hypothetical protein
MGANLGIQHVFNLPLHCHCLHRPVYAVISLAERSKSEVGQPAY